MQRVYAETYSDEGFRDEVVANHPAPRLRQRAQRAAAPRGLRSFDEDKV